MENYLHDLQVNIHVKNALKKQGENMLKSLLRNGNTKIGKDTLIFNMCSATDCPSKKLGLCKIRKCYALKAEKMYIHPILNCLKFRRKQTRYWGKTNIIKFVQELAIVLQSKSHIKYFRWNESGDFKTQLDIERAALIAAMFPHIIFYTYTHRSDLSYKNLPKNLIISTSNFRRRGMNAFYCVTQFSGKNLQCKANCRICNQCKIKHGKIVEVLEH